MLRRYCLPSRSDGVPRARSARTAPIALGLLALALSSRTARADGDDPAAAATTRALIQTTVSLGTPDVAAVTAEAIENADDALERATRLRAAGDPSHAKVADALAREWAETARDAALAAAAERLADDRKRQAMQAQAQLQRTKALVEESIARLGRLRAALEAASPRIDGTGRISAKGSAP
jgi:hypothetical protein